MRRYPYKKYLLLLGALFLLLSLPPLLTRSLRGKLFAFFSPTFKAANSHSKGFDYERLKAENHLLRIEIDQLRALFDHEVLVASKAIPARVIYRDPGSWSSSVWINVGALTDACIQKNSPVIVDHSLVGVIDYVGKKQSRVRLITDVGLKPAVRAVRGSMQNRVLVDYISPVLRHLSARDDLPLSKEEQGALRRTLSVFKERLSNEGESWYLAKGILQGAGTPLWRSSNHTLRGIGFNYDFPDELGPTQELVESQPLIQKNDVLVTTGMDGVFPPGLSVAEVTKVFPLREGGYTYEIEAIPVVENLDSIQTLFVIPPVGYDGEDQPNQVYELGISR
ncbi:MAG: hypothetical protein S4CHLAM2_13710 [Chlamydiales bacterium]|nr:hypothetical protein [Chlamydiales bacterium]